MEGILQNDQTLYNLKGKIIAIPRVDETLTKKGHSADAKVTGDELRGRVKREDIVDNLISSASDKPLSANQGRVIKRLLDEMNSSYAGTVNFDNTTSGLEATTMQGAIDEIAQSVGDTKDTLDALGDAVEGCIPKTGGTISGGLQFATSTNGHGTVQKNHSATNDYGTQVSDVAKDGKTANINVSALLNMVTFTDNNGEIRTIHHEGNKPFGSYKGNGKAVSRIINTGGIGRLVIVYNKDNFSFVTPQGALSIDVSAGSIEWISSTKAYFLNGTLGITTTSEAFNLADKEYYYQVI